MREGGFPGQAAQGLSLLLYSPGSHEEHIKCSSARAELAINLTGRARPPVGEQADDKNICPTIRAKHNEKPFDVS